VGSYIVRRLLIAIPVFFGITVLVFLFVALAPGDATTAYARPELAADPAAIQLIRERYGLDQPIPIRYLRWLANALQGELGYRILGGQPIVSEVFRALQASLLLTGSAMILGIIIGIPLGVLSAVRQYSKIDFFLTGLTFLGISMPSFLLGLGLLYLVG
jgi:peptide/nickel transport system permease protein